MQEKRLVETKEPWPEVASMVKILSKFAAMSYPGITTVGFLM